MRLLKKTTSILSIAFILGTSTLSAAQSNVSGGSWSYGVSSGRVYSNYYHKGSRHYSSVINYNGSYYRGNANAGATSVASLPSGSGTDSSYYGFY